jgi:hypothetical protein
MHAPSHRLLTLLLLALPTVAPAVRAQGAAAVQDTSTAAAIELLRSDVRAKKVEIVTRAIPLTDAQAKVFWPLYRQYDLASSKLLDERVQIIRDFAAGYDSMTDATAVALSQRVFALEDARLKLRRDQFAIFAKQLPGKTVARFFQVDAYVNRAIDLKISDELPLLH